MGLKFVDLPKGQRRTWRREVAQELKANPGKWALVEERATHRNQIPVWANHGCEAATRGNGDGTFRVYARWPEENK